MGVLKRYKMISLWIIFGFIIVFILFDYIIQAELIRENEKEQYYKTKPNYSAGMRLEPVNEKEDVDLAPYLKEYFDEFSCDGVRIKVIDFDVEYKIDYMENCDVWISGDMPVYSLYKGNYPTKEQLNDKKGYAVISYSRESDVYTKDDVEYIDFNGEPFEVTGYLSKYSEWLVNNGTILFAGEDTDVLWECMARYLADGWLYVKFESESELSYIGQIEEMNELAKVISDDNFFVKSLSTVVMDDNYINDRISASKAPSEKQIKYAKLMMILIIVMLCCVFGYWFLLRKSELEIRRKMGCSVFWISMFLYKDALIPATIGVVIGKIVECVYIFLKDGYIALDGNTIYNAFLIMLFCLLIFTVLIFATTLLFVGVFKRIRKSKVG